MGSSVGSFWYLPEDICVGFLFGWASIDCDLRKESVALTDAATFCEPLPRTVNRYRERCWMSQQQIEQFFQKTVESLIPFVLDIGGKLSERWRYGLWDGSSSRRCAV